MTCYNSEAPAGWNLPGLLSTTLKKDFIMEMIRSIPRPLVTEPQRSPAQELTAEYLRSILHYDPESGIFTRKVSTSSRAKVGDVAGCPDGGGYLQIRIQSRLYLAHRLAWLHTYGVWPKDQIDHINRNRSDNRIYNLREVTNKQNLQNAGKYSHNTSGHPGVYWHKQRSKWQVKIRHNQKLIHLGYFSILEEAIAARKAAEKLYWADTQVADTSPM